MLNYEIIEIDECTNMILFIITLATTVRLTWFYDQQFLSGFLREICSGLLITIFFLQT